MVEKWSGKSGSLYLSFLRNHGQEVGNANILSGMRWQTGYFSPVVSLMVGGFKSEVQRRYDESVSVP